MEIIRKKGSSCFLKGYISNFAITGDRRVRQQPLLTVMHTLWLREHNRVANALYAIYGTSKSDEYYYQEARRIVIAEYQHITYHEYLPVILGNSL